MLSVNSILMLWKLMNKQTITGETLYGPGLYGTMLAYKIIGSAQKLIGNTKVIFFTILMIRLTRLL